MARLKYFSFLILPFSFFILHSSFVQAQDARHPITFDEAMNPSQLIDIKYPRVRWGVDKNGRDIYLDPAEATAPKAQAAGKVKGAGEPASPYSLLFTNRQRVWRYATRGDYWLVDNATGERRRLGSGLPEASLMFAKLSPDGQRVAYVSLGNIYLEACSMTDSTITALTTDGSETIVNGTFDWVYEEEFDCRDGFRWSADSRSIAFWQSDTEGTGWFDIINNVDSIYPTVKHFPYPKAGTTNSAVRIGILDADHPGRAPQWLDIPGQPRDNYLPRMEFVPGTGKLMIQQMNRAQNTNTLWTTTVSEGAATQPVVLCTDTDEAWVETNDNIHWLRAGKYFTFTSERDGWRHIYRVSADGQEWQCLTKGAYDVVSEVAYDERRGYLYFTASPHNATERYLYRTRVMGNGQVEAITAAIHPADLQAGQYSYSFSPHCDMAVETWSSAAHVPQHRLVSMDSRGRWHMQRMLEDNAAAQQQIAAGNGLFHLVLHAEPAYIHQIPSGRGGLGAMLFQKAVVVILDLNNFLIVVFNQFGVFPRGFTVEIGSAYPFIILGLRVVQGLDPQIETGDFQAEQKNGNGRQCRQNQKYDQNSNQRSFRIAL